MQNISNYILTLSPNLNPFQYHSQSKLSGYCNQPSPKFPILRSELLSRVLVTHMGKYPATKYLVIWKNEKQVISSSNTLEGWAKGGHSDSKVDKWREWQGSMCQASCQPTGEDFRRVWGLRAIVARQLYLWVLVAMLNLLDWPCWPLTL